MLIVGGYCFVTALEDDGNTITNLATYYPYFPYVLESAIANNITKVCFLLFLFRLFVYIWSNTFLTVLKLYNSQLPIYSVVTLQYRFVLGR